MATLILEVLQIFIRELQRRFHERNPILIDCARRLLESAPKFGQLFWEHRNLLRYDRERQVYRKFGITPKRRESFALDVGSCLVSFILLYDFDGYAFLVSWFLAKQTLISGLN